MFTVLTLADRFLKDTPDEELDELLDEWRSYQVSTDLPSFDQEEDRIDEWWGKVLSTKDGNNKPVYPNLAKLIKIVLILPYNQAPVERVFSMVGKIDTKFRPTLSHSTVSSLVGIKINTSTDCYQTQVSPDLLKAVKSATTVYNSECHASKVMRDECGTKAI